MSEEIALAPLLDAVERYFTLMYEGDVSRFHAVFAPSAQLHGFRDGALRILTAQDYLNIMAASASPKSRNAPRLEEVLLVDFASPTQAMVKVRVRIDPLQYLDHLSYHRIDGTWLITAKSFHVERKYEQASA